MQIVFYASSNCVIYDLSEYFNYYSLLSEHTDAFSRMTDILQPWISYFSQNFYSLVKEV